MDTFIDESEVTSVSDKLKHCFFVGQNINDGSYLL